MAAVYVQVVADLSVEVERAAGAAVVRVVGDLDRLTAPGVEARLAELAADGRLDVVFDASGLAFCDSSGLRVLVEHRRRLGELGGSLRLIGVHGKFQRVLDVTGLRDVFDAVSPAQL